MQNGAGKVENGAQACLLTRAEPLLKLRGNKFRGELGARGDSGEHPLAQRVKLHSQGDGELGVSKTGEQTGERGLPEHAVQGGDIRRADGGPLGVVHDPGESKRSQDLPRSGRRVGQSVGDCQRKGLPEARR